MNLTGCQNRLRESSELFDSIINLHPGTNSILLFLTKFDLLKQKLAYSPLENYISHYTSGDDAESAPNYIRCQFKKANRGNCIIYPHIIEATETTKSRDIVPATKRDIIIAFYSQLGTSL